MINLFLVATGGALGASLRFITSSSLKYFYPSIPLGTFIVNLVGSFFIGFLMNYLENKSISENFIRYFLIIGLLGSFTTFSAFSFENIEMFYDRKFLSSLIYILLSICGCLFFTFLGYHFNKI